MLFNQQVYQAFKITVSSQCKLTKGKLINGTFHLNPSHGTWQQFNLTVPNTWWFFFFPFFCPHRKVVQHLQIKGAMVSRRFLCHCRVFEQSQLYHFFVFLFLSTWYIFYFLVLIKFVISSIPSATEMNGMLHTSRQDNTSSVLLQLHTAPNCQYKVISHKPLVPT